MPSLHNIKDLIVVGETTTSAQGICWSLGQAQSHGAKILLFTTDAGSPLSKMAEHQIVISAPSYRAYECGHDLTSVQPLGTLFEQSILVLCDSLILGLMQCRGVSVMKMFERHANLEQTGDGLMIEMKSEERVFALVEQFHPLGSQS